MPDSREEILLRELEKLRRENENLRSHEQKAQEKLTELKAENEQLESQNKLLETERKKLESVNQKLESVNQKLESVNQKLESDNQNLQAAKQILESKNQKLKDFPQDTVERIYDVYRYSAFTCFKLTDPKNIPDTKEAEPFIVMTPSCLPRAIPLPIPMGRSVKVKTIPYLMITLMLPSSRLKT